MRKIRVHEKALAHLSRGLYRSPASALRELVSNAWDANATMVSINTNFPNFMMVSVRDDGDGFSKEEFQALMEGGIGSSDKRLNSAPLIHGRPVIGRLGIGLLGIAQICLGFTISSRPLKGEGFRARVRLYDLLRETLDGRKATEAGEVVDIGEYEFEEFEPDTTEYGTRIVADDVHPTFTRVFRDSLKLEGYRDPPRSDWAETLKIVSGVHSLRELGDYWRLMWELAACCPVPYLHAHALPCGLVIEEHKKLLSYDFKVVLDGISLRRPVVLSGNPAGYTSAKIEGERASVYDRELAFHGYLVVQEGRQLFPDALQGIMIRIRNVGIGYYDQSMLGYSFSEGPRSRWLTGEVFVDRGLEDALNIDRDSFNRFHPEYRALQEEIHRKLHDDIFPKTYKQIKVRSLERAKKREKERAELLQQVVFENVDKPVIIRHVPGNGELSDRPAVSVTRHGKGIQLTMPTLDSVSTKKAYRQLALAILGIHEVSLQESDPEKRRQLFTSLLLQLLQNW